MMRNQFHIIVLCLIIGLLLNLAVAIAAAHWSTPHQSINDADAEAYRRAIIDELMPGGQPTESVAFDVTGWSGFAAQWRFLSASVVIPNAAPYFGIQAMDVESGWPVRSMRLHHAQIEDGKQSLEIEALIVASRNRINFDAFQSFGNGRLLTVGPIGERPNPVVPILSGTIINTLVYAATVFVLLLAIQSARRSIRARRGRCRQCGYDLRGTANTSQCPECGEAF